MFLNVFSTLPLTQQFILSTECPIAIIKTSHLLNISSIINLISLSFVSLDVVAILICVHTTNIKWTFVLPHVCFFGIAPLTMVTDALIHHLNASTLLVMFGSMSPPFLFQHIPIDSPYQPFDPYISSYPTPISSSQSPLDSPSNPTQPSSTPQPQHINLPKPPIIHTYSRKTHTSTNTSPFEPTSTTHPPTATLSSPGPPSTIDTYPEPAQTQHRPRPSNLRQNPKPTKPYDPSSFHTTINYCETEPPTFTIANKVP